MPPTQIPPTVYVPTVQRKFPPLTSQSPGGNFHPRSNSKQRRTKDGCVEETNVQIFSSQHHLRQWSQKTRKKCGKDKTKA